MTFTAIGLGVPRNLTEVSGVEQQGPAGGNLADPFVVLVLDQNEDPVAGATVIFAVTAGGGTLSVTTATTDENGRAATTLTLGSQPGTNTVVASADDLEPVTFTATGKASPDFDGDGTVGFSDFAWFATKFGLSQGDEGYDARFDLDGNGAIGFGDFLIFASSFGKDVPSSDSGGGEGGGGSSQACAVGLALNPGDGCSGSGYSLRNDAGVLVADRNIGGIAMDNTRFSGGSVQLNRLHLTRSGNVWTLVGLP